MFIKKLAALSLIFYYSSIIAQEIKPNSKNNYSFIGLGYSIGNTIHSISIFPETKEQQGFDVSFGKTTFDDTLLWAKHLNYPKTGFLLSYSNFGNTKLLGYGITFMPFLDFTVLENLTKGIHFQAGLGGSYNNKIYDKVTNPGNYGISTTINWTFRAFLYYTFLQNKDYALKVGFGATHFSNGHTHFPNHGLNSVLASLKTDIYFQKNQTPIVINELDNNNSDTQNYFSTRFGLGKRVLSRDYNMQKNVYTSSFSMGKIINKTYKYGFGLNYRFYEDYYDYIKDDSETKIIVFPYLENSPTLYASAIGVFANFELLMNHISVETEFGVNLYKPVYKIDWQLNNKAIVASIYYPKKYGLMGTLKQIFSTRLGFRYYAFNTKKTPLHNLFFAGNINANLGQADFSEVSFGYVYCPKVVKK